MELPMISGAPLNGTLKRPRPPTSMRMMIARQTTQADETNCATRFPAMTIRAIGMSLLAARRWRDRSRTLLELVGDRQLVAVGLDALEVFLEQLGHRQAAPIAVGARLARQLVERERPFLALRGRELGHDDALLLHGGDRFRVLLGGELADALLVFLAHLLDDLLHLGRQPAPGAQIDGEHVDRHGAEMH